MKQPIMLVPRLREFHWEDLANVHLVASDGHSILLQVEPVKLTVK